MLDRKLILISVLLLAIFIAYDLDPLDLKGKRMTTPATETSEITGFFSSTNLTASFVPAVFFLLAIGMLYYLNNKYNKEEE